ncbi:MAG: hypothetical protein PGN34_01195 [Methylobacterium frigidaeris]
MTKRKPTPATALAAYDAARAAHDTADDELEMAAERCSEIPPGDDSPDALAAKALRRDCADRERTARAALDAAYTAVEPFLAHRNETVAEMRERLGL